MEGKLIDLVAKACAVATFAHRNQTCKFSGAPYLVHPARVYLKTAILRLDPDVQAAAWCHDVLEDCPYVDRTKLEGAIGKGAADIVFELTNPKSDAPRAQRKEDMRFRLASKPYFIRLLKMIDRLDNVSEMFSDLLVGNIPERKQKWVSLYCAESAALVHVLVYPHDQEAKNSLWELAANVVRVLIEIKEFQLELGVKPVESLEIAS